MCVCWPRICVASHVLCSIIYIVVGAIQLIAGIFFFISLPVFKIGSNIWTGVWNVVAGVGGAVFSCVGDLNPNKQQVLLYLTISVLVLNVINLVVLELGEWRIMMPETVKTVIEKRNLQTLVLYARMMTSISTGVAVITSFFDAQFMFCWLEHNLRPRNRLDHKETVSDIEYIIPRVKSGSNNSQGDPSRNTSNSHNVYNQYAQSWVFDTDTVGSSQSDSPYSKLQQFNGSKTVILKRKTKRPDCEQISNTISTTSKSKSQPMVLVEDTTCNNDRQLQFMTSFSRTPSPVGHNSDSSSPASNPPMIYECLERLTEPSVYRSRLNTALVINAERMSPCVSPRPHSIVVSDQVQYASLMMELEKTIVAKFPTSKSPDNRSENITRQSSRRPSSRDDASSHHHHQHNLQSSSQTQSDTDFSKELEAALQLIQDLESPNTAETPSDHPAVISTTYHPGDDEDQHTKPRCLISQMTECSTDLDSGSNSSSSSDGKKQYCYLHHAYCDNCYNMSQQPLQKKTKQEQLQYHQNDDDILSPVKSLYDNHNGYQPLLSDKNKRTFNVLDKIDESEQHDGKKKLDLDSYLSSEINDNNVNNDISGNYCSNSISNSLAINGDNCNYNDNVIVLSGQTQPSDYSSTSSSSMFVKLRSLLKPRGQSSSYLSRKHRKLILTPELESTILKSESLVHLSEVELIQRYNRNKSEQRKIEEKVWQQINGASNSDTSC
ncbi:uncharacterized protein LOC142329334 isoform X2 [Lycorma delicatula]